MGYRHQPYRKRPSRGKLAVLVLCAALVYAGVLAGVRLVGGRLEAVEAAEPMGSLAGRFSSGELTLQYAGRALRYRERALTNVLLIGVDWTEQAQRASARYDGQADFLLLLSFDREKKTVASLQLDRDIMTPIRIYGPFGDYAGVRTAQLCLSYAYGDSAAENRENAVWAASKLLGGVPIDAAVALDMDSISLLNDALGGVTVTLEEDFSALDPAMTPGTALTLQGKQAEYFVRGRMGVGEGTNAARMRRQRVFMQQAEALLSQRLNEDMNFAGALLDTLSGHMTTDAQRGWLINLAYASRAYTRLDTAALAGSHAVGADGFMEFHADQDALDSLLASLFFE